MTAPVLPAAGDQSAVKAVRAAGGQMTVIALRDIAALAPHVPAWENLAAAAVEPNAYHEPWMMLPALEQFAADQQLVFLLIYAQKATNAEQLGELCGFFPLEFQRRYKGLPLAHLRLWRHLHSSLSTPLVRSGHGPQTLNALFDWLRCDDQGTSLLELSFVNGDGPFQHLLVDHLNEHHRLTHVEEIETRAMLRLGTDAESYLRGVMSGEDRKKHRQKRRRLGELGTVETRQMECEADLEQWVDWFLRLEASGWKGKEGTALADKESNRKFFKAVTRQGFERQRLRMLGLFLNGQPVALKCYFLMGQGAIGFKIAYDENFARFSPGSLLEVDAIERLHSQHETRWMDSCAVSQSSMFNWLYKDRQSMQTILISSGRRGGNLAVSALPLLRWLKRLIKKPAHE